MGRVVNLNPRSAILPISAIDDMTEYLRNYGAILGKKAIHALAPLHVPSRDELPDFSDCLRDPFPAQKHVIAAAVKMFDKVGSGFLCGEMGTGKTVIGMLAAHKHAQRSRRQGGSNGKYRAIVLCPDHLIGKWCREIEETIPGVTVVRFGPQGGDAVEKPKRRQEGGEARVEQQGHPPRRRRPLRAAGQRETAGPSPRGPSSTCSAATRRSGCPTGRAWPT